MPYAGISIPVGSNSDSYSVGHNLGFLLGAHVTQGFSLGLEVNVDYMNPGPLASETQTDFCLAPLFFSRDPRRLWVIGFKLGVSSLTRTTSDDYGRADGYSGTGFVWGGSVGGFVPVGPVAVGFLTRLTLRSMPKSCEEGGEGTICHDGGRNGISPALSTLDFVSAVLF